MAYIITIAIYLTVLVTIGAILAFRVKSQEDFMIAGRKLTAPVLVGTLLATWIGSGDIFSVADLSYHHGYSSLIGSAGGWSGIIVVYFSAGRVRTFGQFTVPDILEARYNQWARLLATIISTANSSLLVPATNVMRDVYQRFINPKISDRSIIFYSRIVVIILGFMVFTLMQFFPRILDAAYAAYTVYGAGLTPALMAVFFWKRATPHAGVASIVAGMLVTIIWEVVRKIQGDFLFGVPAIYPALICSLLCLIVISLIQNPPDEEKWKPFFTSSTNEE